MESSCRTHALSVPGTLSAMKTALTITLAISLLFLSQSSPLAWRVEAIAGTIQEISEQAVYVEGDRGINVFELRGVCSWCEDGLDVIVVFQSPTMATMRPEPNPLNNKPVRMFIVRDGREEEF